jgi:hypothetical protein
MKTWQKLSVWIGIPLLVVGLWSYLYYVTIREPSTPPHGHAIPLPAIDVRFYGSMNNGLDVNLENTGTSDIHILQIYVGTSSSSLQKQTSASLPTTCPVGEIARITLNYTWTPGTTYYFKIIAQEQVLGPLETQAPVSW